MIVVDHMTLCSINERGWSDKVLYAPYSYSVADDAQQAAPVLGVRLYSVAKHNKRSGYDDARAAFIMIIGRTIGTHRAVNCDRST